MELGSITIRNRTGGLSRACMELCRAAAPPSLGFEARSRRNGSIALPAKLGLGGSLGARNIRGIGHVGLSASREESSNFPDIDIEKEKEDLKSGAQESEDAWQQALSSFKGQALKMQSLSREAYDKYMERALVVLKETSENLKIQADKSREDLSVIAQEIVEESRQYFNTASENSPEHVKDIVETFTNSTDEFNDVSTLRDFYVGIPYGAFLSGGGFLTFMLTGSVPAIRFGVILGGALLALSISSLRSWKKGKKISPLLLKGQAAIASILFLRELRCALKEPVIANLFTALVSGAVVAFYLYRIIRDRGQAGSSNVEVNPQT